MQESENEMEKGLELVQMGKYAEVRRPTIRFINTFSPVVPLYEEIFPRLIENGIEPNALVCKGTYREGSGCGKEYLGRFWETVWVPPPLRSSKRWCGLFYFVLGAVRLIKSTANLNVMLTQPPLFFILGALVSKITKTPYIIHVMDMYPELLSVAGRLKSDGVVMRTLSTLGGLAIKRAQGVITIGRCMRERMVASGAPVGRIWVQPNWASTKIEPVEKENDFRRAHGLAGKFILMYSGNMGISHHFSTIVEVARRLGGKPDIIFVFVGRGIRREDLYRASLSNRNIRLLDYQGEDNLKYSLGAADIHFISLRSGFEGLVVPSKFYGALASGRPVIYEGSPTGEVARAIFESQCGSVVEPGDVKGLEREILRYYRDRELLEWEGKNARSVYVAKYSEKEGANAYVASLKALLGEMKADNLKTKS